MDIFLISSILFIGAVGVAEYFLLVTMQHNRLFHIGIPTLIARFNLNKNFNARGEEKRLNMKFSEGYNKVKFSVQSDSLIIFREIYCSGV